MPTLSVQVKGAELVSKGLENLADEIPKISAGRIYGRMYAAKIQLQRCPPQTNAPQPFKTDKQRKFFFAALKDGRIKVPYQRTRTLAEGWEIQRTPSAQRNSQGYSLTNAVAYAEMVHGNAYGAGQIAYHRGNWPLMRDKVENEIKSLPQEIENNIKMVARRSGF